MDDGFDHLRALLPDVRLADLGRLIGSDRSRVRRVRADSRSLIVKEFLTAGEGWVRESAALAVIPHGVRAPRLVAAEGIPPIVVMTDAGPGASVAGALLGTDSGAAADAVVAFRREVEAAATGWAYLSASWFLPRALLDDPPSAHRDRP